MMDVITYAYSLFSHSVSSCYIPTTVLSQKLPKVSISYSKYDCVQLYSLYIRVRSRRCGCLVTWFCYHLIAKPGNKTATPAWPDPYNVSIIIIDSSVISIFLRGRTVPIPASQKLRFYSGSMPCLIQITAWENNYVYINAVMWLILLNHALNSIWIYYWGSQR